MYQRKFLMGPLSIDGKSRELKIEDCKMQIANWSGHFAIFNFHFSICNSFPNAAGLSQAITKRHQQSTPRFLRPTLPTRVRQVQHPGSARAALKPLEALRRGAAR